ncbi:hypothetical protein B0A49_08584 [Cryomyces minteri]|uniref:Uncharacterized protein n=1 Tax=Cryomyces minteri TaxID=331657 RepID=A0A4U0WLF0_9PEZI|nr:hypothetical protein B0A49_08584 [Cryomyces minteri]
MQPALSATNKAIVVTGTGSGSGRAPRAAGAEEALKQVAGQDVLVPNAGITISPEPIAQTSVAEWWRVVETNVKGCMATVHAFLPSHNAGAAIVAVSAGSIGFPAASRFCGGEPAYNASKIAQVRLREHLAAENADLFVASVHPGLVATEMFDDDVSLPAHFMVRVTSPEARFLRCSWDVDELKARAKEIMETEMLTANILGWPFSRSKKVQRTVQIV